MKLSWFQVQGYKNFTSPVRLDDLGTFNVIHGDNNVGKSNLLESFGLFFLAMQALRKEIQGGPSIGERYERRVKIIDPASIPAPEGGSPRWVVSSHKYFTEGGFPLDEIFNFQKPDPIVFDACVELERREGDPLGADCPAIARIRLERIQTDVLVTFLELSSGPGKLGFAHALASVDERIEFLLDRLGPRVNGKSSPPPFVLLRSDRTVVGEEGEPLMTRSPLPRALARQLNILQTAKDARREEFLRFLDLLECMRDLVGPGTWRMEFDMETDRAELALETTPKVPPMPLRLMGSGIQQIALLCARLVMTPADIFAIEEPELNLRWSVQRALHDLLLRVGREPGGPQFFFTSHSGQFETAATSYILSRTEAGPRIHKVSVENGLAYTQPELTSPPPGARAPQSYVTTEGLVQIPVNIRQKLGLTHGGGVVFLQDKDGHHLLLTDEQYFDLFEEREQES